VTTRRSPPRVRFVLALFLAWVWPALAAEPPGAGEVPPAPQYSVKGYGFLGNLKIKRTVAALDDEGDDRRFFPASFLEDAALIILSQVGQDGFLKARLEATIRRADGSTLVHTFRDDAFESLPRPMRAGEVTFRVEPGILYYFDRIEFEDLTHIPPKEAIGFFQISGVLINSKKDRLYTPAVLQGGLASLVESLRRLGYRGATAVASEVEINHETGQVSVRVIVEEGPRTRIRKAAINLSSPLEPKPALEAPVPGPDTPFTQLWLQDTGLKLRASLYASGFADLKLDWRIEPVESADSDLLVDVVAEVQTGPVIRIEQVFHQGLEHTHLPTVERRINLPLGSLLNPFELEEARRRLRRLGSFDAVTYQQESVTDTERNIVFTFEEGKSRDVSLMLGYGSYEQIRGGIELNHYNIFGRAHRSRLKFVQSMKSTNADFTYSVPEVFGEHLDGNLRLYGLRREEVSFTRLEAGVSTGLRHFFEPLGMDLQVSYNYEFLGSRDSQLDPGDVADDAIAATIRFDASRDKRDNPLLPRSGYRLYGESETSSRVLGATVNYQRFGFAASWHRVITEGFWLHLGLKHGVIFPYGSDDDSLPVNKLFFPGGENSVRGYTRGEAAPRDENGVVIGAESSFVANVELEVALSTSIGLVLFSDSTFNAAVIEDYPGNEALFSVGLGLRYNTVVGPIRLEYGHNLHPRELDPSGTLHFSIGFPF